MWCNLWLFKRNEIQFRLRKLCVQIYHRWCARHVVINPTSKMSKQQRLNRLSVFLNLTAVVQTSTAPRIWQWWWCKRRQRYNSRWWRSTWELLYFRFPKHCKETCWIRFRWCNLLIVSVLMEVWKHKSSHL